MNEAPGQGPASGFDPASQGPSAGALLRRARENAGLPVDSVAAALKVPVRTLEALEADRFELLPDAVFARALAASVCRNLKIDPALILQRLPATDRPNLEPPGRSINAPFRAPGDRAGPRWPDQLSRPVFLAVLALLLGALVLVLLPVRRDEIATDRQQAPAAGVSTQTVPVANPAVPQAVVANAPPAFVASEPAPAVAAPGPAAEGIVVFKARKASWVQVTDAKGVVALRKLLAAGESASASGALPLSVTVGSAAATDVQVRGKPLDLAPLSRDGVARFEVK